MLATTTKTKHDDTTWISGAGHISNHMAKAAQALEHIEVQINGRKRVFFTFFAENGPTPVTTWDEDNTPIELDHAYFDYMKRGEKLYFLPVRPDEGNMQLKEGDRILFRFFLGVNAIEGEVLFQKAVWNRHGERVLRTTFPKRLKHTPQRRHFRARVPVNMALNCRIEAPGVTPFNAKVLDLSVGGISLKSENGPEDLPSGREVTLTLEAPGVPHLRLRAYTRGCHPLLARHGDELALLAPRHFRSGFQFDLPTLATEAQVSEFVVLVQRETLKTRGRTRNRQPSAKRKKSVRKQLAQEVGRLFHRFRPVHN